MTEPREYIDDIFEKPQPNIFARAVERLLTRYYMWRVSKQFKVMR